MRSSNDTIYGLSTGSLPAGVAVIRISGLRANDALDVFHVKHSEPRTVIWRELRTKANGLIDKALILTFNAPHSFTGENVVELHVHGSSAVVAAIFDELNDIETFRLAEPGEFTRRAFANNKLDLTEVEGLADLLNAQTELQRKVAVEQFDGRLRSVMEDWRQELVAIRASVEADFDFADEEDVPGSVADTMGEKASQLKDIIRATLKRGNEGEIIRRGLTIVLAGAPNTGKSSLLNALAKRDVAIVTNEAGTTRDLIEVSLDLSGQLVRLIDTAGLRETTEIVEQEGIRRALEAMEFADLVLWLLPSDECEFPSDLDVYRSPSPFIIVRSKSDLFQPSKHSERFDSETIYSVVKASTVEANGLDDLISEINRFVSDMVQSFDGRDSEVLLTRARHREALSQCAMALERACDGSVPLEIRVEYLRQASDWIGRLLGRIDVEDILGHIFSEFCIGK